jgi:hypothetical protein
MTDPTAPDPNAPPAPPPASAPPAAPTAPPATPPAVTDISPNVVAPPADTRTDGERHQDLLREVADHSAPPVGAEQVMMKEGENA